MVTHAGMTTEEFRTSLKTGSLRFAIPGSSDLTPSWSTSRCSKLLTYLRANAFKTFIVSGGGIEFMRPWTEQVYGVPPEKWSDRRSRRSSRCATAGRTLFRLPQMNFIDDNVGKPVGINEFIGRRPIAAFGNSDGDLEMLQWTTMSGGSSPWHARPSYRCGT